MLNRYPSELLATKDAEERMKILFELLSTVPVSTPWSRGLKLREHGCHRRWAPNPLFGGGVHIEGVTPVEKDENGLMLRCEGRLLTGNFYDPDHSLCNYQDEEEGETWYQRSRNNFWHQKVRSPEGPHIYEESIDKHVGSSLGII